MQSSTGRGIIYIAAGEDYVEFAARSAESVKQYCPHLPIHLFSDLEEPPRDCFDSTTVIENPHRRSKVDYISQTPFARTLYLDADTRVCADITEMFDLLDRFDIALAHDHKRNLRVTAEPWRVPIPDCFPQLNTGVILFKRSKPVVELFNSWKEAYHTSGFKKDQTTLRELIWLSNLRIAILPPEYNIRYQKQIDMWEVDEALPRILHYERFKYELTGPLRKRLRLAPRVWGRSLRRKLYLARRAIYMRLLGQRRRHPF